MYAASLHPNLVVVIFKKHLHMKAAILYSGTYGSTCQYARWLGNATGFPVFDVHSDQVPTAEFDLLILGTSIIVGKPTIAGWVKKHWPMIRDKKLLIYSVSGTEPGHPDLNTWMQQHLGDQLPAMHYVQLRGRLVLSEVSWWLRLMLRLVGAVSKDPDVKRRMTEGFDFMDPEKLKPILQWVTRQIPAAAEKNDRVPAYA